MALRTSGRIGTPSPAAIQLALLDNADLDFSAEGVDAANRVGGTLNHFRYALQTAAAKIGETLDQSNDLERHLKTAYPLFTAYIVLNFLALKPAASLTHAGCTRVWRRIRLQAETTALRADETQIRRLIAAQVTSLAERAQINEQHKTVVESAVRKIVALLGRIGIGVSVKTEPVSDRPDEPARSDTPPPAEPASAPSPPEPASAPVSRGEAAALGDE